MRWTPPLAGAFALSFRGARTPPLPHDASAAAVAEALNVLPTMGGVAVVRHALGRDGAAAPRPRKRSSEFN